MIQVQIYGEVHEENRILNIILTKQPEQIHIIVSSAISFPAEKMKVSLILTS